MTVSDYVRSKPDPARVARKLVFYISSTLLIPLSVAILPPADGAWWILKILGGLFALIFLGTYLTRLDFYRDLLGDAYSAYLVIVVTYAAALFLTHSPVCLVFYSIAVFLHIGLIPAITKHIIHKRNIQETPNQEERGAPSQVLNDETIWLGVVAATRKFRPLIVSWLEAAERYERIGDEFVLYFPPHQSIALQSLQRPNNLQFLQECLSPTSLNLRLEPALLPSPNTQHPGALDTVRDGSSFERAIVLEGAILVVAPFLEYEYLEERYPGHNKTRQSLQKYNGRSFDVVTFTTTDGETKTFYFALTDISAIQNA